MTRRGGSWSQGAALLAGLLLVAGCGGSGGGGGGEAPPALGPYLREPALNGCLGIDASDARAGVLLHSGELRLARVDLPVRGRSFAFGLVRTYRSLGGVSGPLGLGWTALCFMKLVEEVGGDVLHHTGDGRVFRYVALGGGAYTSPRGWFTRLRKDGTGFTLRHPDGLKQRFHLDGRLLSWTNRLGDVVQFLYTGALLTTILDDLGRSYVLAYNVSNLLATLTDFTGRQCVYTYDAQQRLISVRTPTVVGTPTANDFPAGRTERYGYLAPGPDPDLLDDLTSVIAPAEVADASNTPRMQVTYGTSGPPRDRVTALTLGGTNTSGVPAGGTFGYAYDFAPTGGPAGTTSRTTVTDRNGNVTRYDFSATGHMLRAVETTGGGDVTTACEYNAEGHVTRRVEALGNETCLLYDSGNPDRFQQGNLLRVTRKPDAGRGGDQAELVTTYTYDPIYNLRRTITSPRGNDASYVPQNGGAPSAARYTTTFTFDWQEAAAPPAEAVDWNLVVPGSLLGLGDVNDDGRTDQALGQVVQVDLPAVMLDAAGKQVGVDGPVQQRRLRFQHNDFGQLVQLEDARGNLDSFAYHPEQDPDGDGMDITPGRDVTTGGYLAARVRDALLGANRQDPGPALALTSTYLYDPRGNEIQRTDPRGFTWLTTFNALDEPIVTQTPKVDGSQPDGYLRHAIYDANGRVVTLRVENETTDPNTHLPAPGSGPPFFDTTYVYDILDRRVRRTVDATRDAAIPPSVQPEILTTEWSYDGNENVVEVRAPLAAAGSDPQSRVLVAYDSRDLPVAVTRGGAGPAASTWTYGYDANRNRVSWTDAVGPHTHAWVYDGFDRPVRTADRLGNTCDWTYDPEGNAIRQECRGPVDGGGGGHALLAATCFLFDEANRRFGHDRDLFLPVAPTSGATVTEGALVAGDGKVNLRFEFDANDRPTFRIEDDLACYGSTYDGADRLVRATLPLVDPAGPTPTATDFTYDANDNLVRMDETHSSPDGLSPPVVLTTHYVYDSLNRRVRTTDAQGETRYVEYDSRDNVTATFDPRGSPVADPLGLFGGQINDRGNGTLYFYDGANRRWLTRSELRVGGEGANALDTSNPDNSDGLIDVLRAYDANSRLVACSDDLDNTTTWAYDSLDRRTLRTNADGGTCSWTYDADHRVTGSTDENGTVHTYTYDALDRLRRHDLVAAAGRTVAGGTLPFLVGTTQQTFQYDGLSRLTRSTDDNDPALPGDDAVVELRYDSLSRLVEDRQDAGVVGFSYEADDRTEVRYPGGRVVHRTYDAHDQLIGVSNLSSLTVAMSHLGTAAHAPLRIDRSTPGGLRARSIRTLDLDLLVTQIDHMNAAAQATGSSTGISRTRDDRLLAHTRQSSVPGGGFYNDGLSWELDSVGRLAVEDLAQGGAANLVREIDVRLDGAGAITRVDLAFGFGAPSNTDTRTANRSAVHEITDTPFVHDGSGATGTGLRTEDADRIIQWDGCGRPRVIRSASNPATVIATYEYDAHPAIAGGRRVRKTVTNSGPLDGTTRFLYDGPAVIQESDGAGDITREFVFGRHAGDPLAMDVDTNADGVPDELFFYNKDLSGNVVGLIDASGVPQEFYSLPWLDLPVAVDGSTLVPTGPSAHGNPLIGWGQRFEPETQLYVTPQGFFDPVTGEFLDRDLGLPAEAASGVTPRAFKDGESPHDVFAERVFADVLSEEDRLPCGYRPRTDTFFGEVPCMMPPGANLDDYILINTSKWKDAGDKQDPPRTTSWALDGISDGLVIPVPKFGMLDPVEVGTAMLDFVPSAGVAPPRRLRRIVVNDTRHPPWRPWLYNQDPAPAQTSPLLTWILRLQRLAVSPYKGALLAAGPPGGPTPLLGPRYATGASIDEAEFPVNSYVCGTPKDMEKMYRRFSRAAVRRKVLKGRLWSPTQPTCGPLYD